MAHTSPRQTQYQFHHAFRKLVNFNDTGIGTGVYVGTFPAGAIITSTAVMIEVAFNAATTNVLTAGTNASSYNNLCAAGDVDETAKALTVGIKPTGTALGALAADTDFFVMYTQTGTAATTGQAEIIITYFCNNDQ